MGRREKPGRERSHSGSSEWAGQPIGSRVAKALLLGCALAGSSGATAAPRGEAPRAEGCRDGAAAQAYLNRLRLALRLPELAGSEALGRAAESHAAYLGRSRARGAPAGVVDGHAESPGRPGFTGETPDARALHAGYPHQAVSENVYSGGEDPREAVDRLMSGIYHRFGFLDPDLDQVGVGACGTSHVFLMGRADLERVCAQPPVEALFVAPYPVACDGGLLLDAGYMERWCASPPREALLRGSGEYVQPCGEGVRVAIRWWKAFCASPPAAGRHRQGSHYATPCANAPERRIAAQYLDALKQRRLERGPRYVAWPQDGVGTVEPSFSNERPDPVPDRQETGYPPSIEFNPAHVGQVSVEAFRLYRVLDDGTQEPVPVTRLLSQRSDPNRRLSAHQFALFPLARLRWGSRYRVEVRAVVDGRSETVSWTFATRSLGMPVHRVHGAPTRIRYAPGRPLAIDLTSAGDREREGEDLSVWARGGVPVGLDSVDRSTLRIEIGAATCDPIQLRRGQRVLAELVAEGCR
jgi:uncharacterized protein YkwD